MSRRIPAALDSPATEVAAQVDPGRTSMFAALRYRDFRLFWSGHMVSNIGAWMQMFGMGWLIVLLATADGDVRLAPLYLGLQGLARALPGLGLGLVAGAIADRVDRRQLMLYTQVLAGLISLLLATLTATGAINIWAVLVISAANSAVFSFDAPTRQSMVPRLVPARDLMSAIGLNSAAFNGPQVIGPALGGVLIGLAGAGINGVAILFFVNAATYLAVIAALLFMKPIPLTATGPQRSVLHSVRDGLRYMRSDPVIRWTIVLAAISSFFARPYIFLLPAVAVNVLLVGATELSWLLAATGLGAFAGSITVANLGGVKRRGRAYLIFALATGASLVLFTLQRELVAALMAAFLVGLCMMVFMGLSNTILQTNSEDHMRGRVMSAHTMVFMGLMPLGQLTIGALGTLFGVGVVLMGGGVVMAVAGLVALFSLRALRELTSARKSHTHPHPPQAASAAE